jgi:hypothetical protein
MPEALGVKTLQLPSAPLGSQEATPQGVSNAEQSGAGSHGFRVLVMVQTMSLCVLGTGTLSVVQSVQLMTGVGVKLQVPAPTTSQAKSVKQWREALPVQRPTRSTHLIDDA